MLSPPPPPPANETKAEDQPPPPPPPTSFKGLFDKEKKEPCQDITNTEKPPLDLVDVNNIEKDEDEKPPTAWGKHVQKPATDRAMQNAKLEAKNAEMTQKLAEKVLNSKSKKSSTSKDGNSSFQFEAPRQRSSLKKARPKLKRSNSSFCNFDTLTDSQDSTAVTSNTPKDATPTCPPELTKSVSDPLAKFDPEISLDCDASIFGAKNSVSFFDNDDDSVFASAEKAMEKEVDKVARFSSFSHQILCKFSWIC